MIYKMLGSVQVRCVLIEVPLIKNESADELESARH